MSVHHSRARINRQALFRPGRANAELNADFGSPNDVQRTPGQDWIRQFSLPPLRKPHEMQDIYEMHLKSGVPLRHLKKLQRLGFLRSIDPENPEIAKMICTLKKGNPLGALQLTILAENPSLVWDLGRYASKAKEQVEALGDVKADAPSSMIAVTLIEAAKREPNLEAVGTLERWMKRVIPADREVSHQFMAARALFGLSVSSKPFYAGRAALAFLNVRRQPSFDGWFTLRRGRYERNATFYHQPSFDL